MLKGLKVSNGECYILTDYFDRLYYSNIDVDEGTLVICDKAVYFTDARYFGAVRDKLNGTLIEARLFSGFSSIGDYLKEKGINKVGLCYQKVSAASYLEYLNCGYEIFDATNAIAKPRSQKSEEEIKNISTACGIIQKSYYEALKLLKVGMTEKEFALIIEDNAKKLGASKMSFSTIVAFGNNAAVPHHQTGEDKLLPNTAVLVDTGCVYNGYCSDFTRTAFFGKPDKEFLDCYNAVLEANEKTLDGIKENDTCASAHNIAVEVLKKYGLENYFTHSTGHGLGLQIHESPTLSFKSKDCLKNGTVFTVEPGVYLDGKFGIRIEDTAVMEKGKAKRLFTDDKKLIIL